MAARSARAYAVLGLTGGRWASRADTAWAHGGPTPLARPEHAGVFAARVVAYRRGDTTYFRPFVATDGDSSNRGRRHIAFCGAIGRTAQAGGSAPRDEEPDDSLPVWRRRP